MQNRLIGKLTKSVLALGVAVAFSAVSVGIGTPAVAATPGAAIVSKTLVGSTDKTETKNGSTSVTSLAPSKEGIEESRAHITRERAKDIAAFDRKVQIVNNSEATMAYLLSYEGVEDDLQVGALAVSMPEEALIGFTDMIDKGVIEFDVSTNSDGSFTTVMTVNEPTNGSGGVTTFGLGSLPQCPSAWAAFWAWFAVNGAMCGALIAMPVAAFVCAAGYAVGGAIIDFNAGCK